MIPQNSQFSIPRAICSLPIFLKHFEVNSEAILEISDKVDSDINISTGFSEFIILSIQYHSFILRVYLAPFCLIYWLEGPMGLKRKSFKIMIDTLNV